MKIITKNKKAGFDYYFIRELVAGIQLYGTEVRSIREGKISIVDSYCYFRNSELFIKGMTISEGLNFSHDPKRDKKLLLNRKELNKLERDLLEGMSIVPKQVFFNDKGKIKVEIALVRGKKNYDKRNSMKEKEIAKNLRNY